MQTMAAVAIRHTHPISDDELLRLSSLNPMYRIERDAEGRVVVTPPSGMASDRRCAELCRQLGNWNHERGDGMVFSSSAGFRLPDSSVLSPDAAWVSRDRWEALTREQQETFGPLTPDVVFEVRSASDEYEYLVEKMRRYIANGVRLAALIDPYEHHILILRPGSAPIRYDGNGTCSFSPELPEFVLDVAPLFT